jgi:uncharacterized membrane protein YfcA
MPLGPIRIFFMLFFGVEALVVFGTNLAISFVMMSATVLNNFKAGRINFKLGIIFFIFGVSGAYFGGLFSEVFPKDFLLWIVTIMIFISGFFILKAVHFPKNNSEEISQNFLIKNIVAGILNFIISLLGGAVGMVLGALRYPVMVNYLKADAKSASATNSSINLMAALFAFIGHLNMSGLSGNSHFDLSLFLPLGITGFISSYIGSKHIGKFSNKSILKTLYILLLIMGLLMIYRLIVQG